MAKRNTTDANDSAPFPDPNAPQQGDAPVSWSVEDMQRLDEQQTEQATMLSSLIAKIEQLESRFSTQEMLLSKLDLGEGILPAEIATGVKLEAVYVGALQAALLAIASANPMGVNNQNSRVRDANIKCAFDIAEGFLNEAVRRSALRQKQ